jgi:hypothetical protein
MKPTQLSEAKALFDCRVYQLRQLVKLSGMNSTDCVEALNKASKDLLDTIDALADMASQSARAEAEAITIIEPIEATTDYGIVELPEGTNIVEEDGKLKATVSL